MSKECKTVSTFFVESNFKIFPKVDVTFAFTSARRSNTSLTYTANSHFGFGRAGLSGSGAKDATKEDETNDSHTVR